MTREEAIKALKHTEDNIKYDERREEIYFTDKWVQAYEMAIAALREQEERSKGCEYCQRFDDPCGVPMIATEEDDCDRGIYLYNGYLCANGGSFCDAKVRFCPMCGRKLEVEHEN